MLKAIAIFGAMMACAVNAKIITTNKIKDVKAALKQADSETLVIFDCDDVLIEACDEILKAVHEKELGKLISDYLVLGKSVKSRAKKDGYAHYYDIVLRSAKHKLVDPEWPTIIEDLQKRDVRVLLLSSCLVGRLEETESVPLKRYKDLCCFGIDFQKSWDCAEKIIISGLKSGSSSEQKHAVFYKGMLLCLSGTKGEVLEAFCSKIQTKFGKIIFIDDRMENIKDVERVARKMGVSFVGIEYTYAKTRPHLSLDLRRAKKQMDILIREDRWVSDEKMMPDDFELVLQKILRSHYPDATVKSYVPQYADKYSFKEAVFISLISQDRIQGL